MLIALSDIRRNQLKKCLGPAGPGKAWHHIVEQNPKNIQKFGPEKIHNIDNVIAIDHGKGSFHNTISRYYSSKRTFTGGKTVRKWLNENNFEEQETFGMNIIYDVLNGVIK